MAASKTLNREQRIARARTAARAAHSLDSYIKRIVARAPELTAEQRDRLATLLRTPSQNGGQ